MTRYASLSDVKGLAAPAPVTAAPEAPNSFQQGLRQGMTAAGGQLNALAGGIAERAGFADVAASQYAQSKAAEALAAQQAPAVADWRQVANAPDLSTGLRNAGSYVAGLAGQSVPALGAGLGAAALGGLTRGGGAAAMLAGTAAVAPLEAGGAIQRQQADPEMLKADAATRLNTALGEGVTRAGLSMAVPMLMGGKVLGKGLAPMTMGQAVSTNLAEGVLGNAAAGAASEGVTTLAMDSLNANRDKSGDDARMADAVVGGAALGVPFAGAGIAAHAVRGKAPAPRTDGVRLDGSVPAATDEGIGAAAPAKQTLAERVRGVFTRDPDAAAADIIAAGKDDIDVDALRAATPEVQKTMLGEADAKRGSTAKGWFDNLMADKDLDPEARAKLDEAGTDLGSRANQTIVAGIKAARDAGKKAVDAAQDFYRQATGKKDAALAELDAARTVEGEARVVDDPAKSEVAAGTDKVIADIISPKLAKQFPELVKNETAMKAVTGGLRRVMTELRDTGKIDDGIVKHLGNWFGKETPSVLAKLHDAVLDRADPDATARYFGALGKMADDAEARKGIHTKVREALPEHLKDDVTDGELDSLVGHLREYARGDYAKDVPPERAAFERRQIEESLREHFGDKTDDIVSLFDNEKQAKGEALDEGADDRDYALSDESGFADGQDFGSTSERDVQARFYGGGKDKHAPQFVMSEQAHRAKYGNENSQAARLLATARAENPDMAVRTVSAREYAQRHEIPKERLNEMAGGDPDNHVMVVAEGFNNKDGLTWQQVDKLRLDTHKYPDSKSRVETDAGTTLDAKRMMELYRPEHMLPRNETDAISPYHRMARQMKEAIATLSDHTGEAIYVPDDAVVGKVGGKMVTWGEVQKQSKLDAGPTAKMQAARAVAEAAGDHEAVAGIDHALTEAVLKSNDPDDVLATGLPKVKLEDRRVAGAKYMAKLSAELKAAGDEAGPRPDPKDLRRQALEMDDMVDRMEADSKRGVQGDLLHPQEREMWSKRADGLRELADALDASGGKRWLSMKERAAMKKLRAAEDLYSTIDREIAAARKPASEFARDKDARGMSDTPLDGNVHAAAREHGDEALGGKFAASRNMEAGPENNMLHADNFHAPKRAAKSGENVANFDGSIPEAQRLAIGTKVASLAALKTSDGAKMNIPAQRVAAKAQQLYNLMQNGGMRVMDQGVFASIVKDKKVSSIAETVNELHTKYAARIEAGEAKQSTFVERVVGKGDVSAVTKSIRASSDPVALRRVVDALGPHQYDASARAVLEVANERLGKLIEQDPDVAYSMQRTNAGLHQTGKPLTDIKAHIDKVLGGTVDVEFKKMLHAGEFLRDSTRKYAGLNDDVIRISIHALDPAGVGYHESLHAFFKKLRDNGMMTELHPLMRAAESIPVKLRLQELLANEPDALKQLASAEERVAYMYQFWAKGDLALPAKPQGIFGAIAGMVKKVLGIWTNDQRATHIMEYFHNGEYAKQMNNDVAVRESLRAGTNRAVESFKEMAKPLTRLSEALLSTGDARLRGSMIPALVELADKVYAPLQGEHGDPGYMPAARTKRSEVMNNLATSLGKFETAEITDALTAMQRGEKGTSTNEKIIIRTVRKVLDDTHAYMEAAGVKVGDLGVGRDYFPRVWDPQAILKNETAFRDMLEHYRTKGEFGGSTDQIIAILTRADGSELQTETVKPGMQYTKQRVLGFISALDAAPFMQKDAYRTINSYVTQATRRAEWARRFSDDGSKLHELFERAKAEGAKPEDLQTASDYLQGVDGTLGDKMNPKLRRLYGSLIVYQNVRLLPLAIFSSLIDPGGIVVRGGTAGDAFRAMKRGFAEIPKGFKKGVKNDAATDLAAQLGVIDDAVLQDAIGSSYSQGMVGDMGRKINDTFFKYNLMEQYNRSMRVAATEAAVGFLARHADGTESPHSARWLAELGFKPGEIKTGAGGRMLIHAHEFEASGMAPDAAQVMGDRMTMAINKWVDGAVLRPNAAHKPVWMNDPRFALLSHLKQFVYAFQETILKRVVNETRHGNVGPAYALAAYVPFMIAADMMKGALVSGGGVPNAKEGWDMGDYLWNGLQRAGLFGVGQFGIDAAKDVHRGGYGIGALGGPMLEQLGDVASVAAGPQQFKTLALNALPANAVLDGAGEMLKAE